MGKAHAHKKQLIQFNADPNRRSSIAVYLYVPRRESLSCLWKCYRCNLVYYICNWKGFYYSNVQQIHVQQLNKPCNNTHTHTWRMILIQHRTFSTMKRKKTTITTTTIPIDLSLAYPLKLYTIHSFAESLSLSLSSHSNRKKLFILE